VADCLARPERYSEREIRFLRSIEREPTLTDAQGRWLAALADPVDFARINSAALAILPALLRRWLPQGRMAGAEWVALNPKRADGTPGSFRINAATGQWADFATPHRSGDVISLAAYLHHSGDQFGAGPALREMLSL
jgi:hypothetical protein